MKNLIPIAIFLAIILGFLFPKGTIFQSLILPLSAIMMYLSVLEAEITFKKIFRKELIYWALINLAIQPIFAYLIGSFFVKDLWLGIFLATISPSGINSPVFINLLDGDTQLGVSTSVLANAFSMFFIPFLLFIFFGMKISIPYDQILITTFGLSLIPIVFAILTKKFLRDFRGRIVKYSNIILSFSFFIILWVIFSSASSQIWSFRTEIILLIPTVFLVVFVGYFVGYIFDKKKKFKRTLTILGGYKNQSLMLGIIYANFNNIVTIPVVIYIIFHHTFNAILIWLHNRKK